MLSKLSLRKTIGLFGLVLVLAAAWQIGAPGKRLTIIQAERNSVPITFMLPAEAEPGSRPLVLVAHGFAGSSVFMRGFALKLAYAGYVVAFWDFDGHARNPRPLGSNLLENAILALEEAHSLGLGDPERVAILGHSMGSGVAMEFGQRYANTQATIAISPVGTTVTPQLPRNLLLLAGELETGFVQNAQQRLAEAGGAGGNFADGSARRLQLIPWVEHIGIVFSPVSHQAAVNWLDDTFGKQPGAREYIDLRILWYGLGVCGMLLAAFCLIPLSDALPGSGRSRWQRLLAIPLGAAGATLLLWLLEQAGFNLAKSFGLLVGGYLLVWFAAAGCMALLLLLPSGSPAQTRQWLFRPGRGGLAFAVLIAAALWVGMGWLGADVWLPWLLIAPRLALWPLGTVLMLPWFLAVGQAASPANLPGRLGWWLVQSLSMVVILFLAIQLNRGLSFLLLILPLFPLLLGAHSVAAWRQRNAWAFGLSAALFMSWVVLAVFPLI